MTKVDGQPSSAIGHSPTPLELFAQKELKVGLIKYT